MPKIISFWTVFANHLLAGIVHRTYKIESYIEGARACIQLFTEIVCVWFIKWPIIRSHFHEL